MLFILVSVVLLRFSSADPCTYKDGKTCIQVINNCPFTIWPGILGPGNPANGGFRLDSHQTHNVMVPDRWRAGRIWARTGCDDKYNCDTGFCGNKLGRSGAGGVPPVSLAEFTLGAHGNQDYYHVSLVDGYNLPVFIEPYDSTAKPNGGKFDCKRAGGCFKDLNDVNICPPELQLKKNGRNVACKSACLAFNEDRYCCRGDTCTKIIKFNEDRDCCRGDTCTKIIKFNEDRYCCRRAFNIPKRCNPTTWPKNYAQIFKDACPKAYSYAYDDPSNTFSCRGKGTISPVYKVQFC